MENFHSGKTAATVEEGIFILLNDSDIFKIIWIMSKMDNLEIKSNHVFWWILMK